MAIEKTIVLKVDADQANKSLNQTEQELNDVAKASGKAAEEIKKTNKSLDEILMSTDDVNKKLKDLDQTVATSPKNFRDLNKQIQAYQTIALQAGRESAVGKEALAKASALKDQMVDLQNETKRLADDNKNLQGVLGVGTGVLAGFSAYQGVLAATGVESEKLQETMVKLQAAQSALNGIVQLQTAFQKESAAMLLINNLRTKAATIATTNFGKALIATGLGAIVAVVGALAANWDKVTEFLRGTTKQQEAYNEVANKAVEIASEELNALDKLQRTINDETVSREDKNAAVKELQEGYPDLLKNIDAEEVSLTELNKAIELNSELVMLNAQMQAIAELRSEAMKEKIQAATDAQTGQNESWYDGLTSLFAYGNGLDDVVNKETLAANRTREATKEAEDKINVYDELEKSTKEQIAAIKESIGATEEETKTVEKNTKEIDKNVEKREEQEDIIGRFVRANQERQVEELQSDIVLTDAKISNSNRLYAAIVENLKKEAEERKLKEAEELQRAKEIESAKLELAGATLQGIGSLVNAFAGENEEQQRRAFNISKAISIAQATIDTYKGATAAFASTAASPLGIANPAAPFIAAAAAVAAGLANVATIARQQYQGGGSGGAGGGAGASNPPAELSNPATFNVVGNTGTNQLAQTLGQQPLQAYVVAGDVTSAQSLERNKIQQSTL
jgi:DNA repair exonuclease SbcCD ATPase subunit